MIPAILTVGTKIGFSIFRIRDGVELPDDSFVAISLSDLRRLVDGAKMRRANRAKVWEQNADALIEPKSGGLWIYNSGF